MKRRLLYLVLSMCLILGLLSGCAKKSSSETQTTADKTTVAVTEVKTTVADSENDESTTVESSEPSEESTITETSIKTEEGISEKGTYTSKDEVALYIHLYGRLPSNYITKKEAKNLGWVADENNLWEVASGKSLGGDKFGNREGLLPNADGREYFECDIDYAGGKRSSKRIVYSNDGLVFYTEDNYKNFTELYSNGTEEATSEETKTEPETAEAETTTVEETQEPENSITEDGTYSSKEEVALYIHLYGHLPSNYITKNEAEDLGWNSSKGNLWKVAPGKSIGGNRFGNYEGQLPDVKGRKYYECDIDFDGGYRNAKRIIFSNDGMVYYTEDHYKTFELLYGEE